MNYRRTRKEAMVGFALWALAGLWAVGVSWWLGYDRPAESLGGVPSWVVWGIFLPWVVFFVVQCWYSLFYLEDDDDS